MATFLVLSGSAQAQSAKSRIGVWNIEKLSTTAKRGFPELKGNQSLPPRSEADLVKMADYIENELDVDALMITEIAADASESTSDRPQSAQLNRVCDHLGSEWRYFLGRTGGEMRLGFLFNTEKVRIKKLVNLTAREFRVSGKDVYDRDPFIAWISFLDGNQEKNDLILVCLHLKSQQRPFRNNRMAAVAKLIGDLTDAKTREALELPSSREEPEILFLGDANDSTFKNPGFKYMFDYLNGVGFQHIRNGGNYPHTRINGSQIDHIFGSRRVIDDSVIPGSFRVHHVPFPERDAYRASLSDHFPVTVDIRLGNDRDPSVREALPMAESLEAGPLPDDEDNEPIRVDAEIISGDLERILAPARPSAPTAATLEESAPHARSMMPSQEMDRKSGDRTALAVALELVQKEIREMAMKPGAPKPHDLKRVERLIQSEKELVKLMLQK